MSTQNCVFCKILAGQLPAKVIAQTDDIIVIDNIAPKAAIHYLIIPKKHVHDITALTQDDVTLAGDMLLMAKQLASNLSGSQAFRLIVNNGSDVGQSVFHLHFHFLAGQRFCDF
ncbi:MAG TPA: HIT domain-containing protein [Candidatus Babeliales bacterium]|jgi:histidine triad (HIT) family protein|nr:HIT domain-containing protein [Candidatus Babeliales bacterium]